MLEEITGGLLVGLTDKKSFTTGVKWSVFFTILSNCNL
jgi:hypothetical protein